jgi:molybdopterin-biosynthesis enzyme MoeA-like protein
MPATPSHRIGLLIIGDEILSGRRQDKHLARAIEILAARGQRLHGARFIGDEAGGLTDCLRQIRASGEICFTFGGIGATPDDLTRQSMAAAFETALERHAGAQAEIENRYGENAYPHRIVMADLPRGAELIPNPINRVPGFSVGHVHCLPGFPEMAWPMMEWVLDNRYPDLPATRVTETSVIVHGARESDLVDWMNAFVERHPELKLFSLPRFLANGGFEIELGVGGAPAAARSGIEEIKRMLDEAGYRYRDPG